MIHCCWEGKETKGMYNMICIYNIYMTFLTFFLFLFLFFWCFFFAKSVNKVH